MVIVSRDRDSLHAVVSSVERAKRKVEELKIAAHEEIADITTWGEKLESDLAAVDDDMEIISQCLSNIDQEQVDKTRNFSTTNSWKHQTQIKTQVTWETKMVNKASQRNCKARNYEVSWKYPRLNTVLGPIQRRDRQV